MIPDKFHNPYHFVPLPRTGKPGNGWKAAQPYHQASPPCLEAGHSRFAKDRHTGRIACTLTTVTPIFIGAQRYREASDEEPAGIAPYELRGRPAIPATSLRGMISAIAEAASGSAMRVLDAGRPMSYRMETNQTHKKVGMVIQHKSGTLYIRDLTANTKTKYRSGDKITIDGQEKALFEFADELDLEKFYYQDPNNNHIYYSSEGAGRIRGKFRVMNARRRNFPKSAQHRDFFIEIPTALNRRECHEIPKPVLADFHARADEISERFNKPDAPNDRLLPYHPLGTRRNPDPRRFGARIRLKAGDLVYFSLDKENKVSDLALSAIWRGSKGRLEAFIEDKELLPFNAARNRLSPAERVFGFVEERAGEEETPRGSAAAYAGHVRFSAARWNETLPENADSPYQEEVTLKILDSPKPPSPALYFTNKRGNIARIGKEQLNPQDHVPQGRKFYLHKQNPAGDDDPWRTRDEGARLKQKARITPLRRKLTFTFQMDFDNLDDFELGMLLYALNPNDNFHHKIGMGKPLGLGSVKITIDKLQLSDRQARYKREGPFAASKEEDTSSWKAIDEEEWRKIRDHSFRQAISQIQPQILEALETLGKPDSVTAPVQYPQVASIDGRPLTQRQQEQENYRWWVANDRPNRRHSPPEAQQLKPVGGAKLPVLEKHRYKNKT